MGMETPGPIGIEDGGIVAGGIDPGPIVMPGGGIGIEDGGIVPEMSTVCTVHRATAYSMAPYELAILCYVVLRMIVTLC